MGVQSGGVTPKCLVRITETVSKKGLNSEQCKADLKNLNNRVYIVIKIM